MKKHPGSSFKILGIRRQDVITSSRCRFHRLDMTRQSAGEDDMSSMMSQQRMQEQAVTMSGTGKKG